MKKTIALLVVAACSLGAEAQYQFDIQTKKLGADIPKTMYGIFFEDINFGADGGLYAELVENRSFEFPDHTMGWEVFGNTCIKDILPAFERNPHYMVLKKQVIAIGKLVWRIMASLEWD